MHGAPASTHGTESPLHPLNTARGGFSFNNLGHYRGGYIPPRPSRNSIKEVFTRGGRLHVLVYDSTMNVYEFINPNVDDLYAIMEREC